MNMFFKLRLPDEKKGGECYQSKAGLVKRMMANQSRRGTEEHQVALLKKGGSGKAQNKYTELKFYQEQML